MKQWQLYCNRQVTWTVGCENMTGKVLSASGYPSILIRRSDGREITIAARALKPIIRKRRA